MFKSIVVVTEESLLGSIIIGEILQKLFPLFKAFIHNCSYGLENLLLIRIGVALTIEVD
jgi:hypothetical protein